MSIFQIRKFDSITPDVGSIQDDIYISINGSDFTVGSDDDGNPILPKVWVGDQPVNINCCI